MKNSFKLRFFHLVRWPGSWVVFAAFLVALGCRTQADTTDPSTFETVPKSQRVKAPDFKLDDIAGGSVTLADLKGKVVFIDFWATWCPPCVVSAPSVDKINEEYKGRDVIVLSVSIDDDIDVVKSFVQRKKLTNRILMAGQTNINAHYRVEGIPAFFVIDKEGYFLASWTGFSPAMVRDWRRALDHALKT